MKCHLEYIFYRHFSIVSNFAGIGSVTVGIWVILDMVIGRAQILTVILNHSSLGMINYMHFKNI